MSNAPPSPRSAFPPGPLTRALEHPNAVYTQSGMTVFHFLIAQGRLDPEQVLRFIRAGALVNARANAGNSPLATAAANRDPPLVRTLLHAGADVEKYEAETGRSLLSFLHEARRGLVSDAAGSWRTENEILSCLLAAGACPDGINGGKPPLIGAIENKNPEAMALLLRHGADPVFSFAATGRLPPRTPLMSAMMQGNAKSLAILLDHRPDIVNLPVNHHQRSALHWAIGERAAPSILECLLQRGADPNQPDHAGFRPSFPLHLAVLCKRADAVDLLLRHGANPLLKSGHGETGYGLALRMYGEENSITARLKLAESAALRELEISGKKTIDAPRRHP